MRVLFLDTVHPSLEQSLREQGFECDHDYTSRHDELLKIVGDYQGLVIRSRIAVDEALLNAAGKLVFIARSGSGLENIDLAAAAKRGIEVLSSPEGNRDAVGEHIIGMLLMLMNRLHLANVEVKSGTWDRERNRGLELKGRNVGIIGYGHMGSSLAAKLKGFGCTILAYDKYLKGYGNEDVTEVSLAELMQEAEILSIHLPLSEETKYFVDESFIEHMARPFYLINTARGQHVNTDALVQSLQNGKVLGACLDVLEFEKRSLEGLDNKETPESFRFLCESDKVVLSPHVAGWTQESYVKLSQVLAAKVQDLNLL